MNLHLLKPKTHAYFTNTKLPRRSVASGNMEKDEAEFDRCLYVGRVRPNKVAHSAPLKSDPKSERQGYYYREEYAQGKAVVKPLQLKASVPDPEATASNLQDPSLHQNTQACGIPAASLLPRLMGQSSFAQTPAKLPAATQPTPLELDKINLQKTARYN